MKYTIFSIDDSRRHYTDKIRKTLRSWEEVETPCVDGRIPEVLDHAQWYYSGIPITADVIKVGQLGIWYTVLNALSGVIDEPLITFEDDALLGSNFLLNWQMRSKSIPEDTDFFSLFLPRDSDHLYNEDMAVNRHVTRTYQTYGGVSMYYTPHGAEKIFSLLVRDGITGQYDNTLYRYAREGELNGYCSKPSLPDLVYISGNEKSIVQESDMFPNRLYDVEEV